MVRAVTSSCNDGYNGVCVYQIHLADLVALVFVVRLVNADLFHPEMLHSELLSYGDTIFNNFLEAGRVVVRGSRRLLFSPHGGQGHIPISFWSLDHPADAAVEDVETTKG